MGSERLLGAVMAGSAGGTGLHNYARDRHAAGDGTLIVLLRHDVKSGEQVKAGLQALR